MLRMGIIGVLVALPWNGIHPSFAESPGDKVVEKAIEAQGGEAALKQLKRYSRLGSLSVVTSGKPVVMKETFLVDFPSRMSHRARLPSVFEVINVINRKMGWQATGGASQRLSKKRWKELQEDLREWAMATLLPLRDGKRRKVTLVPQGKEKELVGITVQEKGKPDVQMFFRNGLLEKLTSQRSIGAESKVAVELRFFDYKPVDKVRLPMRIERYENGKKKWELEVEKYALIEKAPPGAFEKP